MVLSAATPRRAAAEETREALWGTICGKGPPMTVGQKC